MSTLLSRCPCCWAKCAWELCKRQYVFKYGKQFAMGCFLEPFQALV